MKFCLTKLILAVAVIAIVIYLTSTKATDVATSPAQTEQPRLSNGVQNIVDQYNQAQAQASSLIKVFNV